MRVLSLLLFVFSFVAMAAPPQTIVIQTNAQCGMCKVTIEKNLYALKGVKEAVLDLETKQVTIKYKAKKVSPDALRQAISMAGYQADDVAANAEAQANLSDCCKPKPGDTPKSCSSAKAKKSCCASKAGSSCASKKDGSL